MRTKAGLCQHGKTQQILSYFKSPFVNLKLGKKLHDNVSILEDKIQYVSDGSNCAMKVPHSLFVLILLSCLTPFYFYSPRDFLNSVPEGRDLQLHDL